MAMEGKNIAKKSGIYLVGNLTSKVMSSLLLPIYAIYVSAAELGSYDMVTTVCGIIIPIAFSCLWEAILRFVLKETSEENIGKYINSVLLYILALTGIMWVGGFAVKQFLPISNQYYYFGIAYILVTGAAQIFQAMARATKHNKVYVVAGISSTAVNFLGVLVFVCWLRFGTYGLLISTILGQIAIIIVDLIGAKIWKYISIKRISFSVLKKMLVFSVPLILNQIIMWLISGFSKIVINVHIGVEANGLYSFANKFSTLVTTFGSVVAMALFEEAVLASNSPDFGAKYGKAITNLNKAFYALITIAFPAIIVFYQLFAGQEYMASKELVPLLLIYSIMVNFSTNLGSLFQVIDKTKYQFITTLLGTIGSCGLSYLLVFKFEIHGVVIGQLIGSLILVFSRYLFVEKYAKIDIKFGEIAVQLLFFIVVVLITINRGIAFNVVAFIIVCLVEVFMNRTLVASMVNKIRKK